VLRRQQGLASSVRRQALHSFYDGRRDTYVNTDVSDKKEAVMMHVNSATPAGVGPKHARYAYPCRLQGRSGGEHVGGEQRGGGGALALLRSGG
jgi:hypothetical protein